MIASGLSELFALVPVCEELRARISHAEYVEPLEIRFADFELRSEQFTDRFSTAPKTGSDWPVVRDLFSRAAFPASRSLQIRASDAAGAINSVLSESTAGTAGSAVGIRPA